MTLCTSHNVAQQWTIPAKNCKIGVSHAGNAARPPSGDYIAEKVVGAGKAGAAQDKLLAITWHSRSNGVTPIRGDCIHGLTQAENIDRTGRELGHR